MKKSYGKFGNIDVEYIIGIICLFFTCFPYIALIPTNSDIQPNAFLFCSLYFCISALPKLAQGKLPLGNIGKASLIIIVYFLLIALVTQNIFLKRLITYFSIFFFCYFGYNYDLTQKSAKLVIALSIVTWGFVGVYQLTVSSLAFSDLLPRMTATMHGVRGVTSLATEPSHYALQITQLLVLSAISFRKSIAPIRIILALLAFTQIVWLAQSATGIIALGVLLILIFTIDFKPIYILLPLTLVAAFITLKHYNPSSRAVDIYRTMTRDPSLLLKKDGSIKVRIGEAYYSISSIYHKLPLAFGASISDIYALKAYNDKTYLGIFGPRVSMNGYVASGLGGALYEIGFLALCLPIAIFMTLLSLKDRLMRAFLIFALFLVCGPVALATPIIGVILGNIDKLGMERLARQQ